MPSSQDDDRTAPEGSPPASGLLQEMRAAAETGDGRHIAVEDLLRGAGLRLYGLALLVFALPEAIPFPAVGLTGLVAIPIAVVAATMAIRGGRGRLPGWIRHRRIRRDWVIRVAEKGSALVRRLERVSYARMVHVTEYARPLGVLCVLLCGVMAIPFPFSNVPPGIVVVAIGLGIFQRDGLLVLVAAAGGVLVLAGAAGLLILGERLLF